MKTWDTVWTIRLPAKIGVGIVHVIGARRQDAWERAAELLDASRASLEQQGYCAMQVDIMSLGK